MSAGEFKSVIGRRIPLATQPGAGGLLAQPTQLISARVDRPRQWVITLAQIVKQSTGTTWAFATPTGNTIGEGYKTWTPATNNPSVPTVIAPAFDQDQAMQVELRWGAGGASFVTRFDYPVNGRSFGLTADTVDLSVVFRKPVSTAYPNAGAVPIVGAFMVEGQATDTRPLSWMEAPVNITAAAAFGYWTVKPYARSVRIRWNGAGNPNDLVGFIDAAGSNITAFQPTVAMMTDPNGVELPVPPSAVGLSYNVGDIQTPAVLVEWSIGLM